MQDTHDKQGHFNLEEMELHSDVDIHGDRASTEEAMASDETDASSSQPRPRRQPAKKNRGAVGILTFLVVLLLGGGGFLGYTYLNLKKAHDELLKTTEEAKKTLNQTSGAFADTKEALEQKDQQLKQTSQDKDSLEKQASNLKQNVDRLQKDLTAKNKEVDNLKASLDRSVKEANALKADVSGRDRQIKNLEKRRDELETSVKSIQSDLSKMQAEHQQELQQLKDSTDLTIGNLESLNKKLEADLSAVKSELTRMRQDKESEARETQRILRDLAQRNQEANNLRAQIRDLESGLELRDAKIERLEKIDHGELVPFSDEVQPAQVSYKEPLPPGLKFPRKIPFIAVEALINEAGGVDKVFLSPGQDVIEQELSNAVTACVRKWKFHPPQVGSVRVKTWQTIIFRPEI